MNISSVIEIILRRPGRRAKAGMAGAILGAGAQRSLLPPPAPPRYWFV